MKVKSSMLIVKKLLIVSALVLSYAHSAHAAELFVPAQFTSIQDAINAASSGDKITVAPGTYFEAIDFVGKDVHLKSAAGAEQTIIDATGKESSVVLLRNGESTNAVLDGFTITGGIGSYQGPYRLGGGALIYNSSATIRNCIFKGNIAHGGGGLTVKIGFAYIEDSVFTENFADGLGDFGGGAIHTSLSSPIISNCTILRNGAIDGAKGGGLSIVGAAPVVRNTIIAYNIAQHSGAISNNNGRPELDNLTVVNNQANNSGGAIVNTNSSGQPNISNSIFWANNAAAHSEIWDPWFLNGVGSATLIHSSLIAGGWPSPVYQFLGDGQILIDSPQFVNWIPHDLTGFDEFDLMQLDLTGLDLSLATDSPAIDFGNNSFYEGPEVDLAGNERIVNGAIDLGAYEVQEALPELDECAADLDGDGTIGFRDLNTLLSNWGLCVDCGADVDYDGSVGGSDLSIMLSSWGVCG